ncbi:MAG: zinc ribbon domain-containing protein [Aliifodinibius sp.]|nr:zinc ribbon domain-containing protein [Candidatus Saccharibacteria bacterium]NIT61581.1 zinc ribbon domain-containing protein [Fodinibius sp.]NIV16183.1 zinc ribbon domain-containing protein [Fodinibius sp.]NIY30161.1 zinc ribbon domain-containing protein [Fodinibius sp.]
MPIYTYRCENCGIQFDQQQKFSDDPLKLCPECNEEALRKVYLPVGIVFKGKGFYSTDNRSPSGGLTSSSKNEKETSSETKETKSETKSENKSDSTPKTKES